MMSGFENWLSSHDSMSGTYSLLLWAAGVLTALVIIVAVLAVREFAARDIVDVMLRTMAVLVVAVLAWTWLDYSMLRERLAERHALDARASELTAQAIAPGSALACLNAVEDDTVEAACEQALFARPQALAAALAYVDARISLLADGLAYAGRDPSYEGVLQGPRLALEADRFGIVAHVLASRGCTAEECPAFKLLRITSHVRANLREKAFESRVAAHSAGWPNNSAASTGAAVSSAPATASTTTAAAAPPAATTTTPGTPMASKFNFPSSASIPPVSIMSPEPTGTIQPNKADPATAAPAPKPQTARRQTANRPPSAPAKPLPPPPLTAPPPASAPAPVPTPQ